MRPKVQEGLARLGAPEHPLLVSRVLLSVFRTAHSLKDHLGSFAIVNQAQVQRDRGVVYVKGEVAVPGCPVRDGEPVGVTKGECARVLEQRPSEGLDNVNAQRLRQGVESDLGQLDPMQMHRVGSVQHEAALLNGGLDGGDLGEQPLPALI